MRMCCFVTSGYVLITLVAIHVPSHIMDRTVASSRYDVIKMFIVTPLVSAVTRPLSVGFHSRLYFRSAICIL